MEKNNIEELIQESRRIFDTDLEADQVVFLYTAANNRRILINHNIRGGYYGDECEFLEKLRKENDTEIKYMICIWRELGLDISSIHLRNGLVNLNQLNNNTKIITRAERTLKSTLPNP